MVLVKILKRKDASSIIVAIVTAMILAQFLTMTLMELAAILSGTKQDSPDFGSPGWQTTYLQPFVLMILQFVVLEILARAAIFVKSLLSGASKKR